MHDIQYHLNDVVASDTRWSFGGISTVKELIDTQLEMKLSL